MWLINVHTRRLEEFLDCRERAQQYAILSHTWGKEEVRFHEIHHDNARQKKGYRKIDQTCCEAAAEGLGYVWIDTCCINNNSSAELSEAINSMFKWYRNAHVCYAYLDDVDYSVRSNQARPNRTIDPNLETLLKSARWFTRGWTLQELIAPRKVLFFDQNWLLMGSRNQLSAILERITGIDLVAGVDTQKRRNIPAAKKLSWAAYRITTREEDRAYSLFGLFDVFLPLVYGEGTRAFERLQEEILKTTNDQSVLAWQPWLPQQCSLLLSPTCFGFRYAGSVLPRGPRLGSPFDDECELGRKGIRVKVPVAHQQDHTVVALNCKSDAVNICELRLQRIPCPSYRSEADSLPIYWVYRDLGPAEKLSQSSCWLKPDAFLEDWQDGLEWADLWILRRCKGRWIAFYTDGQVDIAETLPQAHWFPRFGQMMFPFHEYDAFCDSNERHIVIRDNISQEKRTLVVRRNNVGWITVHWGQTLASNDHIPSTSTRHILDGAIPTLEWPVRADMVKRGAFSHVSEIIVVLRRVVPQPGSQDDAKILSTTSQSHIMHDPISTKQLLSRRDLVASEAEARHMLWDEVDRNTIFEGTE